MRSLTWPLMFLFLGVLASTAQARKWTDSTGRYSMEANLIAFSSDTAVLQKSGGELISVPFDHLSEKDNEYLQSREAEEVSRRGDQQIWTLRNGLKIPGRVVGYGRRDVVVQRKRGKLYVNDRLFDNLPEIYRRMVLRIVSHFEETPIESEKELLNWTIKQKGEPRRFTCEGVMLELDSGDEYGVPFIFFSEEDLKVLQPGWEQWKAAADAAAQREREDLYLQAQAQAHAQDRQTNRQIAQLELALLATAAGVTDLWEVSMQPKRGVPGRPLSVVVPARDSRQAAAAAMAKYPNYVSGPLRRLN